MSQAAQADSPPASPPVAPPVETLVPPIYSADFDSARLGEGLAQTRPAFYGVSGNLRPANEGANGHSSTSERPRAEVTMRMIDDSSATKHFSLHHEKNTPRSATDPSTGDCHMEHKGSPHGSQRAPASIDSHQRRTSPISGWVCAFRAQVGSFS
jgi:hypothetical protein